MNKEQRRLHDITQLEADVRRLRRRESDRSARAGMLRRLVVATALLGVVSAPIVGSAFDPVPAGDKSDGDPITAQDWNDNFRHVTDGITTLEQRVSTCPEGMTRVGSFCIDDVASGPFDFVGSVLACHDAHKDLCAIEQLAACDQVEPDGSECNAYTKAGDASIWTMSFDLGTASTMPGGLYDAFVILESDNTINISDTQAGIEHSSFCCAPLLPGG